MKKNILKTALIATLLFTGMTVKSQNMDSLMYAKSVEKEVYKMVYAYGISDTITRDSVQCFIGRSAALDVYMFINGFAFHIDEGILWLKIPKERQAAVQALFGGDGKRIKIEKKKGIPNLFINGLPMPNDSIEIE